MPVQYKSLSMDLGSVVLLAGFFPFFFSLSVSLFLDQHRSYAGDVPMF